MNRVRIGWDEIAKGDPVLGEEPLERLTIQVWPGESMDPRVILWYDGWRPRAAPTNPARAPRARWRGDRLQRYERDWRVPEERRLVDCSDR